MEIEKDIKKVFESKIAFKVLCGIGFFIVALLIFYAGIRVGFHKASFGRAWGDNYERNFGMRPDRLPFGQDNFPNGSGAVGKIIKIQLPNIIVQDKSNLEKTILIGADTLIQKAAGNLTSTDLKVDDFIVTIGTPNDQGVIEAKFIRVMPLGMIPSPSLPMMPAPNQPQQ